MYNCKSNVMKTLIKISIILVFIIFLMPDLFAVVKQADPQSTVGVPLDGGLLAILAGAGIAYFSARKKKRTKIE